MVTFRDQLQDRPHIEHSSDWECVTILRYQYDEIVESNRTLRANLWRLMRRTIAFDCVLVVAGLVAGYIAAFVRMAWL